jgi:hypothetical protein
MTRVRSVLGMAITGAALLAVFAATAQALPEVGRCVERPGTGKYRNAGCSEEAKTESEEQFEFLKGAKSETEGVGFTEAGGEGVLETVSGSKYTCETFGATGKYDEDSGEIKEVENVVFVFKGCSLPLLGVKCNSAGAAEGEIRYFSLKGPLGYISGEKTKVPTVGLELTPEKAKGLFAEYECTSSLTHKIKGKEGTVEGRTGGNCLIAPIEPVNTMTLTVQNVYKGSGGKQEPQHFELSTSKFCNLESNSNGGAYEAETWALSTTITNEEELEIKA